MGVSCLPSAVCVVLVMFWQDEPGRGLGVRGAYPSLVYGLSLADQAGLD